MPAMRAESTRLIWPAPTPSVMPPPQKTIALLFTYFATFHANSRSLICSGVGCLRVTTFSSSAETSRLSAVWISMPEPTRFMSFMLRPCANGVAPPGGNAICSTRMFGLAAKTSSASLV